MAFLLAAPGVQTQLTFVRHAETVANGTGRYSAATLNRFTPKGDAEIRELTSRLLAAPPFDTILVSPSPRALKTIAPYLVASHRTAVIWPLLYECCTGRRPAGAYPTAYKLGPRIAVPEELKPLFRLIPGEDRLPVAPSYNAGLAQVRDAVREFHARHLGGRILLVGHSGQGGHFLHELTGRWTMVKNAHEIHVLLP